jgi:hypothetical protein
MWFYDPYMAALFATNDQILYKLSTYNLKKKQMENWLQNAEASVGAFVKKEWAKISGDATAVETALETAATIGVNVVTGLKDWLASPGGQLVEDVISNIPGVGPYVTDVLKFLPQLLIDLNLAKYEFSKSPAQIVSDGISAAVNAPNSNIKATNLAVIAAHITTYVSGLAGAQQSIQSALSATPAVYVGVTPIAIAT